jgi:S-adenosylmethionine hydrolase
MRFGEFSVPHKINGTIVSINEDGNLITDILSDRMEGVPRDDRVTIQCDGHETVGIYTLDHNEPDATLLALIGSSGALELCIVGASAKIMLGVGIGDEVSVQW